MNPAQLSTAVVHALESLVDQGALVLPDGVPTEVTVERPREKGHGDYATNVAMQLAKKAGTNPRALGELLATALREADGIAAVEVAGPGFLNITVEAGAQGAVAADIVAAGAAYGSNDAQAGRPVNVEFISANPTGPIHLGHTRWAVVGDAIARVLEAAGATVTREFYINDRGDQMDLFGAVDRGPGAAVRPVPEDGYRGAYIAELADARARSSTPTLAELAAGGGAGRRSARRVQPAAARAAGSTCAASTRCSTSGSPSELVHERRRRAEPSRGCAGRATSTTRTARSGCAPPTSGTTATGC